MTATKVAHKLREKKAEGENTSKNKKATQTSKSMDKSMYIVQYDAALILESIDDGVDDDDNTIIIP